MESTRDLGTALRLAREAQALDRKQLAQLLDVAPSQITRWEAGAVTPSPRSLMSLARQLELPPAKLFDLAEVPVPEADALPLPAMLRADYDLPPEAIAEIEAHIAQVAERYRTTKPTKSRTERRET